MTKLCARGKAAAKRKFKVYPSAYANAYASKICAGKIKDPSGMKRKDWGPKKKANGGFMGLFKKKEKNEEKKEPKTAVGIAKETLKEKKKRLEELRKELGMNKGGEVNYGKQGKNKMKTKPYGIEDRKIKTETLLSRKERDRLMKDLGPAYRADPTAGKTAPPRKAEGGMIDMTKMKYV